MIYFTMSQSEIATDDKVVVPWFNKNEWIYVYNLISSDVKNRKRALELLKLWKIRVPKLPSGVEGTLIILEALLQDTCMSDENLSLLYGTSIMRFLNICGAYSNKTESFYKMAKKNKLPDWIIDLRNDLAHDQKVPSSFVLHLGLSYCLDWLKTTYWEEQKSVLKDCFISVEENSELIKLKIALPLFRELNDLKYLHPSKVNIGKLFDNHEEITRRLKILCNLKDVNYNTNVGYVLKKLFESIKNLIKKDKNSYTIKYLFDALIEDNPPTSLIPSIQYEEHKLPINVVEKWKNFVEFFYEENLLVDFIKKLFEKSCDLHAEENVRLGASIWLKEIFNNLAICDKADEQCPNQFNFIDLKSDFIDDLKTLQDDILKNPHEFSFCFIEPYLKLLQFPKNFIQDTLSTINSYIIPKQEVTEGVQHSIQDIEEFLDDDIANAVLNNLVQDFSETNVVQNNKNIKKWNLVRDMSIFEGCPLGVLTNQNRENNPLLMINSFN